jgi:hypothetical protein
MRLKSSDFEYEEEERVILVEIKSKWVVFERVSGVAGLKNAQNN